MPKSRRGHFLCKQGVRGGAVIGLAADEPRFGAFFRAADGSDVRRLPALPSNGNASLSAGALRYGQQAAELG